MRDIQTEQDIDANTLHQKIDSMRTMLDLLTRQEENYFTELDAAVQQYNGPREQAAALDVVELYEAHQTDAAPLHGNA